MQLNSDKRSCSDINECFTTIAGVLLHNCTSNEICINVNITGNVNQTKGYKCECRTGYKFDEVDQNCLDEDECAFKCISSGSNCTNLPGSYNCSCLEGYNLVNEDCININECEEDQNICGKGNCTDTIGSFTCKCETGFYYSNGTCVDIDECSFGNFTSCTFPSKTCKNTAGSYNCSCNSDNGFNIFDFSTKTCQSNYLIS